MKIYLAIPYTGVEEESFKLANKIAVEAMKDGHIVYSPVSHNHTIAKEYSLPTDWEYWKETCASFLEWCDELWVVNENMELVSKSIGVQAEIKIATELGKPIFMVNNTEE